MNSLVCCLSGGRDSLVATHYMLAEVEGFEIEKQVVFVDTTVMVPVAVDFVKDVCRQFGWNLHVLRPEPDFWTLARKWGTPSMKRRWCCYALKLKPIFEFVAKLKPQRAMITGLRREESKRREKLPQIIYRKKVPAWSYAPIINWIRKDVLNYIKEHDLPTPPHYRLGIKETCMCGAFAGKKDMMILKALYPELFQQFVELERKRDRAAFFFNNQPCYARDLQKQKTLEEAR